MSTMLLSLLIRVRTEGEAAIARLRENAARSAYQMRVVGDVLGVGMKVATQESRLLGSALAATTEKGKALVGSIVHGSLGVAAAVYAFKKGFLDVAESAEQMRARIKAIEETDGRAEAVMAWTKAFRKSTATTVDDVREAWIELRNNAIRPTGYVLQAIADAAASSGKKMADTAKLFADVVDGKRLSKLDDFGLEAEKNGQQLIFTYRYLGKVFKEAVPKDNKVLVANKLAEILTKLRGGAADAAAKGWRGLMLDMKESWNDFVMEVMEKGGVFETLKAQVAGFAEGNRGLDGMTDNARSLAGVMNEVIVISFRLLAFLRDNIPGVITVARDFTAAVGGWKVVLGGVLLLLSGPFLASLIPLAGAVWALGVTITTIFIPALFALAMTIASTVIPVLWSLATAIMMTPIGWIFAAIAAAWLLYNNWDTVVGALSAVWDLIAAGASAFWEALKSDVAIVAAAFVSAWEGVKSFFVALWDAIKLGYDTTFGAISRGLSELKGMLPSFGDVKLPSISGTLSSIGTAGRNLVDGVVKVAVEVVGPGEATVTQSRMRGPLDMDVSLGHTMATP